MEHEQCYTFYIMLLKLQANKIITRFTQIRLVETH